MENKFVIIYLGSHGIANHLEPVIDLCEELKVLPNIHLLMVGNGLEKEKLMRIANERKLDNITFNDSVSKELVPSLLKRADLSIISMMDSPLYKWGFSMNKLYDYMAAGLPIIMIANPSTAGKLGEVDGVHASLDNTQLISSISLYSNNKTLLKIHSDNLKKYVDNYYSWEKLANILEKHFLEDRINK
nr:glycosyltransferase [Lederbergia lenta]